VSTVFSELRRYQSYADAQAALGRIYAALGLDPAAESIEVLDINAVQRDILRVKAENESRRPAQAQANASPPADAPQPSVIAQPRDERLPIDVPKLSWYLTRGGTPSGDARQEEASATARATDERQPGNSASPVVEASDPREATAQP
jgi:hypothetical protein